MSCCSSLACCNRQPVVDDEISLVSNHSDAGRCKDYESLDYDRCFNEPYRQQILQQSRKKWFETKREFLSWSSIFAIGVFTALVAFFIDTVIRYLTDWKLETVSRLMTNCSSYDCVPSSLFSLVGFNVMFVLVATLLVVYGEPLAAGSGIPEIKCYLNGVKVRNVTRIKTLLCKAIGVLFSVSGGLLVGKEGPMIHSGGVIGAGIPQFQCNSMCKLAINIPIFRSDRDKRDFVSAGAAAGVAAAFGAPIGGVLFSLEEGCSFWNQVLTWKTLFCTMTSTFTLNFFLSGIRTGAWGSFYQSGLLTFGVFQCPPDSPDCHLWTAYDLFIFIAIGFGGGIFGFIFNQLNTVLTRWRINYLSRKLKLAKVIEAIMVAIVTSLVAYLIPYTVGMCKLQNQGSTNSSDNLKQYQQFLCPDGYYNDMATLFYNPQEDAIKMLFHGDAGEFSLITLGVFFIFFFLLSCWTYGASIPSGLFVPCILCGAAYGRFIAHFLYESCGMTDIYLGTFSLIGAAAFLGGVVRMTISLTVILIECTNEISLSLPIMVTVMVAKWVGDMVNEGLYDIHIHLKHVPLLEWESPTIAANLTASDVMSSKIRFILPHTRVRSIIDLLRTTAHNCFPVVTMATPPSIEASSTDLGAHGDVLSSANTRYRYNSYVNRAELVTAKRHRCSTSSSMNRADGLAIPLHINNVSNDNTDIMLGEDGLSQMELLNDYKSMTLHGMILRSQLTSLLHNQVSYPQLLGAENQSKLTYEDFNHDYPRSRDVFDLDINRIETSDIMDVTSYMDPCPFVVSPVTPLPRVFNLFRTMGLRHLPVINHCGEILGLITRHDLTHHHLEEIVRKYSKSSWDA